MLQLFLPHPVCRHPAVDVVFQLVGWLIADGVQGVVPHLALDVGELGVTLVVLLLLRAVNRSVRRSSHGVG